MEARKVMDENLKDEIKILKEKLKNKSKRVRELSDLNKTFRKRADHWFNEFHNEREKFYAMMRFFPKKYYKVEYSGVNEHGNRTSTKIELIKGICAAEIICDIERHYKDGKVHMIEEVAT
jgi:inorganic pyrophosphatase